MIRIIPVKAINVSQAYSLIEIIKEEDFLDLIRGEYGEEVHLLRMMSKKKVPVYHCFVQDVVFVHAGKLKEDKK
jgi:hypothetical protein